MESKLPGEDYMGDIYEGYIPGALDDLHSDGIYCKYIYFMCIDNYFLKML